MSERKSTTGSFGLVLSFPGVSHEGEAPPEPPPTPGSAPITEDNLEAHFAELAEPERREDHSGIPVRVDDNTTAAVKITGRAATLVDTATRRAEVAEERMHEVGILFDLEVKRNADLLDKLRALEAIIDETRARNVSLESSLSAKKRQLVMSRDFNRTLKSTMKLQQERHQRELARYENVVDERIFEQQARVRHLEGALSAALFTAELLRRTVDEQQAELDAVFRMPIHESHPFCRVLQALQNRADQAEVEVKRLSEELGEAKAQAQATTTVASVTPVPPAPRWLLIWATAATILALVAGVWLLARH